MKHTGLELMHKKKRYLLDKMLALSPHRKQQQYGGGNHCTTAIELLNYDAPQK